jgi:beta-phosphoglucomutase
MVKYNFAVFFDMDGVIADTLPYHTAAMEEFCKKHGRPFSAADFKKNMFGKTMYRILDEYIFNGTLEPVKIIEYCNEKDELYLKICEEKDIKPTKGLIARLDELKREEIPKAIVTSDPGEVASVILDKSGVSAHFDRRFYTQDSNYSKTQAYLRAIKELEMNPANSIAIEDSPAGILAAQEAGMKVVGITTTLDRGELEKLKVDLVIDDFTELGLEKLANLFI